MIAQSGECDHLIARLSETDMARSRAGARHLLSIPEVEQVARDPRMVDIIRDALGLEPIPFRATLFEKTQAANWRIAWHQDTALPLEDRFESPGWGPWSIKVGIHYAHAPAWVELSFGGFTWFPRGSSRDAPADRTRLFKIDRTSKAVLHFEYADSRTLIQRHGTIEDHVERGALLQVDLFAPAQ
jgi:hypothetical protein